MKADWPGRAAWCVTAACPCEAVFIVAVEVGGWDLEAQTEEALDAGATIGTTEKAARQGKYMLALLSA